MALIHFLLFSSPPFFFSSSPLSQVLKGSKKLCLSVRSVGRIPGGYVTNHVYTWVDPQGRSVSPPPDLPEHRSATLRRTDSQRRSNMQLLQEGDEKKVRLNMGNKILECFTVCFTQICGTFKGKSKIFKF